MGKLLGVIWIVAGCGGSALDITQNDHPPDLSTVPDLARVPTQSLPDLAGVIDLAQSSPSAGLSIPKSGPPYTGGHTDPGLNSLSDCPDANLEPDDSPSTALSFTPTPDMPTAKIIKLAICPVGNNPATGQHDQDWYKVDLSGGPTGLTLEAEVFYDISLGDLDIAITDAAGNIVVADGTAVANGCVAAQVTNNVFYVVVTGANNVDVAPYELLIRSFTTAQTCP
jgi:hypothetical protein